MRKAPEGRNRHQGALTLIFVMASSGVVKVILSFYRDHEGSAFERHRDRVPFDIEKHNSMEIACKHLKKKIAIVTKAQLNMELPFLMGSTTSELNGGYSVSSFCLEFCPHTHSGCQTTLDHSFPRSVSD